MLVRTPEQSFFIVRILRSTEDEEVSVCRDILEDGGGLYLLIRFKNPTLNRGLLPMLSEQARNPSFSDMIRLFTQDGDLYACFRYHELPTLSFYLEKELLSFRERLGMGSSLLEQMVLFDMPPPLLFEALREENIVVDESQHITFNYVLQSMLSCYNVDIKFISIRLEERFRSLFMEELSARSMPELEAYLYDLNQTIFPDYISIYNGYQKMRELVENRVAEGKAEPETWLFRIWRAIKSLKRFVKPLLAGIVLIATLCYLIYTLLNPEMPKGTPVRFEQIGTVEVQGIAPPDKAQ